jgi:hypothetical protein
MNRRLRPSRCPVHAGHHPEPDVGSRIASTFGLPTRGRLRDPGAAPNAILAFARHRASCSSSARASAQSCRAVETLAARHPDVVDHETSLMRSSASLRSAHRRVWPAIRPPPAGQPFGDRLDRLLPFRIWRAAPPRSCAKPSSSRTRSQRSSSPATAVALDHLHGLAADATGAIELRSRCVST